MYFRITGTVHVGADLEKVRHAIPGLLTVAGLVMFSWAPVSNTADAFTLGEGLFLILYEGRDRPRLV